MAMCEMMSARCTDIRPTEICKMAKISRTTFYAHFNPKNIAEQYENRLKNKFMGNLPAKNIEKEVIFMLLLRFVREERRYFEATMPNANFWLLKMIFAELHVSLRPKDCSDKTYDFYVMQLAMLIFGWVLYDDCAVEKMRCCARKMAKMPMMRMD